METNHMKLFFLFAVLVPLMNCGVSNHCSICPNHTLCIYSGPGKSCKNIGGSGVTAKEKKLIVRTHNQLRSFVAFGKEKRGRNGPQPPAANLLEMRWDNELAKMAQLWADQCLDLQHDPCLKLDKWYVGQNIALFTKYPIHNVNWTESILAWYNEVEIFDPKNVDKYGFEAKTGHYTGMLWHHVNAIGCGRRDYGYKKLYICNYGPGGNIIGQQMYKRGKPCSACPKNTKCRNGLCAKLRRDEDEELSESLPEDYSDYEYENMNGTITIESSEFEDQSVDTEEPDLPFADETSIPGTDEVALEEFVNTEIDSLAQRAKEFLLEFIKKIKRSIKKQ